MRSRNDLRFPHVRRASITTVALPGVLWLGAVLLGAFSLGAAQAEEIKLDPLKTFRSEFLELSVGEGRFPAEFTMGRDDGPENEAPAHRVAIKHKFAIARYEVPQNLWEAVMGNNPSRWHGRRNAVEMISYVEAEEFCRRVTALLRENKLIELDQVVRLPTEAEWEYAARAGTQTVYSFGDDAAELGEYAWYHGNAAGNDPPVGAKRPNAWGLHDVHGYVWEWCSDAWRPDYRAPAADESPRSETQPKHVLRGGSWQDEAERLTSTARRGAAADHKDDGIGLRCVLSKTETP